MKVTLKNIFSFENETIQFDEGKKYLITGVADQPRNGAGKTNLLQAINYAMSGRVVYTEDGRIISKKQIYRDGKHTPFCKLQIKDATIQRGYKNDGLHIRMSGIDSTRNEEHDNKIAEFFGFPTSSDLSKYIYNFVYIHHHTNSLIGAKDSEKTKTLLSFLELESIMTLLSQYRSKKIITKNTIQDFEPHIDVNIEPIDIGQLEQKKKTLADKVDKEGIIHYSLIPGYERQVREIKVEIETTKKDHAKVDAPTEQPVNTDELLKMLEGTPSPNQLRKIEADIQILTKKIDTQNQSFNAKEIDTNIRLIELASKGKEGDTEALTTQLNAIKTEISNNINISNGLELQLKSPFLCPWETCNKAIISIDEKVEKFDGGALQKQIDDLKSKRIELITQQDTIEKEFDAAVVYVKEIQLSQYQIEYTKDHEVLLSERTEKLQELESRRRVAEKSQNLWKQLEEGKKINKEIANYEEVVAKFNTAMDQLKFKMNDAQSKIQSANEGKIYHVEIETLTEEIRQARINNDKYRQSEELKKKVEKLNDKVDYYTFTIRNIPGIISDICTQSVGALQAEMNTILDNMDMGSVRFILNCANGLPKDIILECLSNDNWVPFQGVNTAGREAYRVANIVALRKLYYNQIRNFNWLIFDDATPTARDEAEDSIFRGLGQVKEQGVILATACERAAELFQPDEVIRLRMVDNVTRIE